MPVKKCTKNGKPGFKAGDSGTCYTGPGAKEKATKQLQAIKTSQKSKSLLDKISEVLDNNSRE
jgi:hypothetical protein